MRLLVDGDAIEEGLVDFNSFVFIATCLENGHVEYDIIRAGEHLKKNGWFLTN